MKRRAFQESLVAVLVVLPGCQAAIPDPQDMRVHNFHDERQTVTTIITRPEKSDDPVLRETFSLDSQETRFTRAAFPRPGIYRVSIKLASGPSSATEWQIDSRGLRVEITPEGQFEFEYEPET